MLMIPCPICGPRPELEFRNAGEAHVIRVDNPTATSDAEWSDYLYFRRNPKGLHAERWRHISGCGRFFNCLRDTVSDRILATYPIGTPQPDVSTLIAEQAS